jgi:hypothetical protein
MSEQARSFHAEILAGRRGGAMVEVPFSVRRVYGTGGQVKVRATFDGHSYRGSVAPMGGGVHVLGVGKDVRTAIGKDVGDVVSVTLERDDEPRAVIVPPELAAALASSAAATKGFEGLSYTHRREFAEWVAEGKRAKTRERRAGKAVEMVLEGRSR